MSQRALERQQHDALVKMSAEALECRYYVFHAWKHVQTAVQEKGWIDIRSVCLRCSGTQSRLVNRRTGERLRPRTQVPTRTFGLGRIGTDVVVRAYIEMNVNGQSGEGI